MFSRRFSLLAATAALVTSCCASATHAALVARWDFEEGSGSTAYDTSGAPTTHNGTIFNATHTTAIADNADGTYGMNFNGTTAYIDAGGSGVVDTALGLAGGSYTISWWQNWAGNNGNRQRIISKDSDGLGSGIAINMNYYPAYGAPPANYPFVGGPVLEISQLNGLGNSPAVPVSASIIGSWHHMAVVFDATAGTLTVYIDGVDNATPAAFGSLTGVSPVVNATGENFFIGSRRGMAGSDGQYFVGSLDDIRLYNNALTQSQVVALIPEPASLSLLALGAAAVVRRSRKRNRSN